MKTKKCEFNKTLLEFLGRVFGKDGVMPSTNKIKTIFDLPTPKNASAVQSLLVITNFCRAHFIPN